METPISELDKKNLDDFSDDTIFVWNQTRRKIDPKTGYPIYDIVGKNNIEQGR